jgi:hypothetical protein
VRRPRLKKRRPQDQLASSAVTVDLNIPIAGQKWGVCAGVENEKPNAQFSVPARMREYVRPSYIFGRRARLPRSPTIAVGAELY